MNANYLLFCGVTCRRCVRTYKGMLYNKVEEKKNNNKFYATSLLHPCMVSEQPQMCGDCQQLEKLSPVCVCVWEIHIQEMVRNASIISIFFENSFNFL